MKKATIDCSDLIGTYKLEEMPELLGKIKTKINEVKKLKKVKMKNEWIKVTERLPEANQQVIRYTPNVNISQERMAVQIIDGDILRYAEEDTWWMPIPELPAPLNVQ